MGFRSETVAQSLDTWQRFLHRGGCVLNCRKSHTRINQMNNPLSGDFKGLRSESIWIASKCGHHVYWFRLPQNGGEINSATPKSPAK